MEVVTRWSWTLGLAGAASIFGGTVSYWLLSTVDGPATVFWICGAIGVLLYFVLDRQRLAATAGTRQFQFSSGSLLLQVVVLAIAVVGYVIADRYDQTFDLTTDKKHTLSDQARSVLDALDEPVQILAFFRSGSPEAVRFEQLAKQFEQASDQVTVEWVDPLSNPLKADRYGIVSETGTLVLVQGDRQQKVELDFTEEAIIQKLVVVQSEVTHRVCWVTGHGELDPDDDYAATGLGSVRAALEKLNYQVTRTQVATTGIDRACEALVVASPTNTWLPFEREAFAAYLAEGGRALVLLDPGRDPDFAADLGRFGLAIGDDVVLDIDPRNMMMGVNDPSFVVLSGDSIVHHQVTRDLSGAVVLGVARSVSLLDAPEGLITQELLRTSAQAWAETNLDAEPSPDEGVDRIGNVPVAAVVTIVDPAVIDVVEPSGAPNPAPAVGFDPAAIDLAADLGRAVPADFTPKEGGRLIVIGDADFASNQFMELGNNTDLFLNAIAWLVDEEAQIGERPENTDTLEITALGSGVLCLVSIVFVPGIAVCLAVLTLLRRRYL